jgi:hypothetical protein
LTIGPKDVTAIVVAGVRLELRNDEVAALADHLWKGRMPGAVTGAARLSEALAKDPHPECIEFPPHEVDAVRDGLVSLRLS